MYLAHNCFMYVVVTSSALRVILFYSILMVTMTIGLYFMSKYIIFEGVFHMSSNSSYFYAAIVSICVVHVILGLFIYTVWTEGYDKQKKDA